METKSKSEHYSALVRLRNKFTKNKENDIDAEMANAGGLLRVFEFDRTKNDINTFRAYNLFQSKKIRDKELLFLGMKLEKDDPESEHSEKKSQYKQRQYKQKMELIIYHFPNPALHSQFLVPSS